MTNYLQIAVARSLNKANLDTLQQEALAHAQEVGFRKAASRAKLSTWRFAILTALSIESDRTETAQDDNGKPVYVVDWAGCKDAIDDHVKELLPVVRSEIIVGLAEKAGYDTAFASKKTKDKTITSVDAIVAAATRNIKAYYKAILRAWDAEVRVDNGERDTEGNPVPDSKTMLASRVSDALQKSIASTPKGLASHALGQFAGNAQAIVQDFSAEDGDKAESVKAFADTVNQAFLLFGAGRLSINDVSAALVRVIATAAPAQEAEQPKAEGEPLAPIPAMEEELRQAVGV